MNKRFLAVSAAALLTAASGIGLAWAQLSPPVSLLGSIGLADLFQDIPGGAPAATNSYVTGAMLGNYGSTQPGNNPSNALAGGDFSTGQNLWQRGVSVALASATYYVAYTADRWFAWGGTSTPATITQQADAPTGYLDSLQIVKGSLTGVIPVTIAQEVESANSYQFQGQTAEFDCHLKALSGFSAALSQVLMTISYGTGTDDGSTLYAYGLNAHGGSGTTAWTGQVNASVLVPITTAWQRYSIVAPIPATATEVAAAIGWTPVGTGTSTDGFKMAGCQLVRNSALVTLAGTTNGTATLLNVNDGRAKAFNRRSAAEEAALQYRYYWQTNDAVSTQVYGQGFYYTTTECNIVMNFPFPMRAVPTVAFGGKALDNTTFAVLNATGVTPVALATDYLAAGLAAATTVAGTLEATTASSTAGYACDLIGAATPTTATIGWSAEL